MHRLFVDNNQITNDSIIILGADVNHVKNVLRMRTGEELIICNGQGTDFKCIIDDITNSEINLKVLEYYSTKTELSTKIVLYQGLPKKDKMELIIQKAVELGVSEIVPVMMKRTVVKLDDKKKEAKKLERWQLIAENAAKQSNRGCIPVVREVLSWKEALEESEKLDINLIPYELAQGMKASRQVIEEAVKLKTIGVFIGPEGGFDEDEIAMALGENTKVITLGNRILRTETAGLCILSVLMFQLERE